MNKLKRSGPSIKPCGTPAIIYFFQAAKFIVDLNSLSSKLKKVSLSWFYVIIHVNGFSC